MYTNTQAEKQYNEGLQLVKEEKFIEAYSLLTNILEKSQSLGEKILIEIKYLRANIDISHLSSHFEETLSDYEYLVKKKTKYYSEACTMLTLMYDIAADYESVIVYGEEALKLNTTYTAGIHLALARAYSFFDDEYKLERGLHFINLFIDEIEEDIEEDMVSVLSVKINILISLALFDDAEKELNKMAIHTSGSWQYYYLYSRLYFRKYNLNNEDETLLDKAIDNAKLALQYEDDIEEVKSIISNCYYMKKDYQNAIKYLKMQDETESNIIDQVRIYNDWEHFQDSIDLIQQSIEKYPTWRLYLLLGSSYQSLENFEEARNAYIEAFHISKIPTILGSVTEVDRIQKNDERSFQFLLKELEDTNNPTAQIQLRLGEIALRVGKSYDEMLDYFKKAYENGAISELEYLDYICDYGPNISEISKKIKKNIKKNKLVSYYSKRKQAIRYLYGENGFKQNLKKSLNLIKECMEEYSDDSCDYALLGRFYELSNAYSLALENYQKAYELIKDDDYPGCDCAYGYYAHALLNEIGTNKNVDYAKKIILDAIRKSNTFSCSHVVYYYAYFALQNDERFSKEKAYELLTFDYPFYRFDISRVVSLTQICKSLNRSSLKLEELKKYLNKTYYNKEELEYYDANKDQIASLPYWKNI